MTFGHANRPPGRRVSRRRGIATPLTTEESNLELLIWNELR